MSKKILSSDKAPAAIGPYSQAVQTGNLIFISGQIPIKDGELCLGSIEEQTRIVMENLKAFVEDQGLSMQSIVKASIFLTDMGDFPKVNEIYGEYFQSEPPARACVAVAALPKGVSVEIEAIAETS